VIAGRLSIWFGILVPALLLPLVATGHAPPEAKPPAGSDRFEDRPERFTPARPRTEAERDRVEAAALVAHGRMLYQQQDYAGALKRFQRAHRCSPESVTILSDVVALAFKLGRNEAATRYAIIAAEKDPRDAELTTQLARYLTQRMEFSRAISLYKQAIRLQGKDKPNATTVLLHREIGRLYFVMGDFANAAEAFSLVRDAIADPDRFGLTAQQKEKALGQPELTYLLMGESCLAAGRADEAAAMFKKIDELKPNKGVLAYQMARVEAKQGRTKKALAQLETYFNEKLSVGGTDPYVLLDELLEKTNDSQEEARRESIRKLATLHEDDPANVPLGTHLAGLYRESDDLAAAEKILAGLLKLEPTIDAYRGLIDIYQRNGQMDKLLDTLGDALSKTGRLQPLAEEAEALSSDKAFLDKLIAAARQREKDEPDALGTGVAMAVAGVALADGRYDDADHFFHLALAAADKKAQAQVITQWGLQMFLADEYERAATAFRRAIRDQVAPDEDAGFYYHLAGALAMAGKTDEAVAAASKAAQLEKDSPRYDVRAPWIMYHAERFDQAEKAYRELLEKYDSQYEDSEIREIARDARLVLSNICVRQDRIPEAEEWLQRVLDEFPEDVGAMNDLGYLWTDQGKHLTRSLAMVREAVQAEPDNIAYRDSLGWAYYRLGRYEEAVKELEKAADDEDPDGVILDHLGDAYLQVKDPAKAIAAWRKAITAFEKEKESEKLRATQEKINKTESKLH